MNVNNSAHLRRGKWPRIANEIQLLTPQPSHARIQRCSLQPPAFSIEPEKIPIEAYNVTAKSRQFEGISAGTARYIENRPSLRGVRNQ